MSLLDMIRYKYLMICVWVVIAGTISLDLRKGRRGDVAHLVPTVSVYLSTPSLDSSHYCTINQFPSPTPCPPALNTDETSLYLSVHDVGLSTQHLVT